MLLIDDEADHASINTNKDDQDPTATNNHIRKLLSLFEQSSYLGYTATPFANIFIDPETDSEMINDDLFPKDFIISLDTPTNYVGAKRIFEEDGDLDIVRIIDDYEDHLPLSHKKHELPDELPGSLLEAVEAFILIRAMRLLRGQIDSHNSMLVNVSRFTAIQSRVRLQLHDHLTELRVAIKNHYALPENMAMLNSSMLSLRETWRKEFTNTEFQWSMVQNQLSSAVSPVRVIEVNAAGGSEPLDYSRHSYPSGRNVIAVGGMSLSRGLTLEGLTVSYFLRNSKMYDTLFQMGRWFGYRRDYEDLCRIYMSEDANSWYAHISRVTDELREEFKRMELAKMTPSDFGLCVRSHPETLIVTAKNKMRTGRAVPRLINLEGRLVETAVLTKDKSKVGQNLASADRLVKVLSETSSIDASICDDGYLYQNVPADNIYQFLNAFNNHEASLQTRSDSLINYLKLIEKEGITKWDVVVISLKSNKEELVERLIWNRPVISQKRKVTIHPGNGVEINKRRIASRGQEKYGIEDVKRIQAENEYLGGKTKGNIPDRIYRPLRTKPLLMIHLLDCRVKEDDKVPVFPEGVIAYGISFPGEAGGRKPEKLVEYVVNTVWWRNNYGYLLDNEGEDE